MQGSIINRLMENSVAAEPEVGMGATSTSWSDRHAGTIVGIVRFTSGKRKGEVKEIQWQADKATRTDDHGMSDAQSYEYERQPDAPVAIFRKDARGTFRPTYIDSETGNRRTSKYGGLIIGVRDEHYDYSF